MNIHILGVLVSEREILNSLTFLALQLQQLKLAVVRLTSARLGIQKINIAFKKIFTPKRQMRCEGRTLYSNGSFCQ